MNGRVDESSRALIDLAIRQTESETPTLVTAWIDTAFNGFLVFPHELIHRLGFNRRPPQKPFWQTAIESHWNPSLATSSGSARCERLK